jgi:hypothetical protein
MSFLFTALLRGELSHAFGWSDSPQDPDVDHKPAGAESNEHEEPSPADVKDKIVEEKN